MGIEEVNNLSFVWAVITDIDPEGNKYDELFWIDKDGVVHNFDELEFVPQDEIKNIVKDIKSLKMDVFSVGELLVLSPDEWGRELSGLGRKPSKWFVSYEVFQPHEYREAIARSIEVRDW